MFLQRSKLNCEKKHEENVREKNREKKDDDVFATLEIELWAPSSFERTLRDLAARVVWCNFPRAHPLPPRCQCNIFNFPLTTDISNIPNISNMNFDATFLSHPLPRCQCNIFVFIPLKRHWQQIHQIHLSNDSGHIRNHSIHCVSGHFIRELKSYEK